MTAPERDGEHGQEAMDVLRASMVAVMEQSLSPWAAEQGADLIIADLGFYALGCLDPLGGFHMATSDHQHEEGDPSCRLVVALNGVYFGRHNEPGATS